jgi:hypothetical protein
MRQKPIDGLMSNHIGDGVQFRQAANFIHITQCDHSIHTKAFSLFPLSRTNACNHMSTVLLGNMNSGSSDTADCACNENDLTSPWPNADFNHLGSGQQDKRQCRCVDFVKSRGNSREILGLAQDVFGIRAIHQAEDALACLQADCPLSKRNHLTREVAAENCREFEWHHLLQVTATQLPVDWIDAHRYSLHQHLADCRHWDRCVLVRKPANVPITVQQNRLHRCFCHVLLFPHAGMSHHCNPTESSYATSNRLHCGLWS